MTRILAYGDLLELLPKAQAATATRLGLPIEEDLDREGWSRLVASLVQTAGRTASNRDTLTAWLGDLLAYGSDRYRGQIKEYAEAAGMAAGTLRDAKLVCSRIPVSCRRDTLSWSHHCEIGKAFKEPTVIEQWLGRAEKEKYSRSELRKEIRAALVFARTGSSSARKEDGNRPFALLRELRSLSRFVNNHADIWAEWEPQTCQAALQELKPLSVFMNQLASRAGGNRKNRSA